MTIGIQTNRPPISVNTRYSCCSRTKREERKHAVVPTLIIAILCMLPLVTDAFQTLPLGKTVPSPALCHRHPREKSLVTITCFISPFQQQIRSQCLKLTILHSSSPQGEHPTTENSYNETVVSEIPEVGAEKELTPQERMQLALGIEPETEEDRKARIAKRDALVAKKEKEKLVKLGVAVASGFAAIFNYAYQYTHPITSLSLLSDMQRNSEELAVIGRNGRPTVVDFWAPWCENCKASAPTLSAIEAEYKSQVNFILVNGDLSENWGLIERFGVDAIPHLALLDSDGTVETALIGPIPKSILRADLDVLLSNAALEKKGVDGGKTALPHIMYDAFRNKPDMKKISFD